MHLPAGLINFTSPEISPLKLPMNQSCLFQGTTAGTDFLCFCLLSQPDIEQFSTVASIQMETLSCRRKRESLTPLSKVPFPLAVLLLFGSGLSRMNWGNHIWKERCLWLLTTNRGNRFHHLASQKASTLHSRIVTYRSYMMVISVFPVQIVGVSVISRRILKPKTLKPIFSWHTNDSHGHLSLIFQWSVSFFNVYGISFLCYMLFLWRILALHHLGWLCPVSQRVSEPSANRQCLPLRKMT